MRIAFFSPKGFDILQQKEISRIFHGKFGEFVIVDLIDDYDTLEYCTYIRIYDIVAVIASN